MRMWMVAPKIMCRQHLLGEHNELHKLVGCLNKGRSVWGYVNKGLIDLNNIESRHNELVREMFDRRYIHRSPLVFFLKNTGNCGSIDINKSQTELLSRCVNCRDRKEQLLCANL